MTSNVAQDHYDAVLNDLRAKRAEIDAAIAAIEAIRPVANIAVSTVPANSPRSTVELTSSLSWAARTVLKTAKRPVHVNEIVEILESGGRELRSADKANNIGAILNGRASRKHDVRRVDRGTWEYVPLSERGAQTENIVVEE